jgi:hypothetical protein
MGRFDNIHGDEDEIEYENQRIEETKYYEREEEGIEEWKTSRTN